jgi:hypothetical protein
VKPVAALLLTAVALVRAETRLYREVTGTDTIYHRYTIEETEVGYSVQLDYEQNEAVVRSVQFELDSDWMTLGWRYVDEAQGSDYTATRDGRVISLCGQHKGKPVGREYKIDDAPWLQPMGIDLEPFARSGEEEKRFWVIPPLGPLTLKATRFRAWKAADATIVQDCTEVPAIHVRVAVTGIIGGFWQSDSWFRAEDGVLSRYESIGRADGTLTTIELVERDTD